MNFFITYRRYLLPLVVSWLSVNEFDLRGYIYSFALL